MVIEWVSHEVCLLVDTAPLLSFTPLFSTFGEGEAQREEGHSLCFDSTDLERCTVHRQLNKYRLLRLSDHFSTV